MYLTKYVNEKFANDIKDNELKDPGTGADVEFEFNFHYIDLSRTKNISDFIPHLTRVLNSNEFGFVPSLAGARMAIKYPIVFQQTLQDIGHRGETTWNYIKVAKDADIGDYAALPHEMGHYMLNYFILPQHLSMRGGGNKSHHSLEGMMHEINPTRLNESILRQFKNNVPIEEKKDTNLYRKLGDSLNDVG